MTLGGILGHMVCTGAAVIGGRHLAAHINEKTVGVSAVGCFEGGKGSRRAAGGCGFCMEAAVTGGCYMATQAKEVVLEVSAMLLVERAAAANQEGARKGYTSSASAPGLDCT